MREKKKLTDNNMEPVPSEAFMQRDPDTPLVNNFQIGMMLEANDSRNTSAVCIATVIDMKGPRLRLRLDGTDGLNDFWRLVDSEDIFPFGTCESKGNFLQPPLGYTKKVSTWQAFITKRRENAVKAGQECFPQGPEKPSKNLFQIGQKLEAIDRKNPHLICSATVGDVQENNIFVTFDGWRGSMDYWCDYRSRDIFPVGWCKANNYNLQNPGDRGDNPKVAEKIKEALENRKRRTRSTKPPLSNGGSSSVGGSGWAQNKGLTSTVRDKPTPQRRSITKSNSNNSTPIITNTVPSVNQRLRATAPLSSATETSTSSIAFPAKPVVFSFKSDTPVTTTPVVTPAVSSSADCSKEADSGPATSTAVSVDEIVDQESNKPVKSPSPAPVADTEKELVAETEKEPVAETEEEELIVDTEKDSKSDMKKKKASTAKSSPTKKSPVVQTKDEEMIDDDATSSTLNDTDTEDTATLVEEKNEKPLEAEPSPMVVSENEVDDIQTPDEGMESQPEITDLDAAKGETVAEVKENDVMNDSVSTTTSEKTLASTKSDAGRSDDKAEIKTPKAAETPNNKSTTDTGGEVIEIRDDSMDEGDQHNDKKRSDEVTEGSDSSSSQKKLKKRSVAASPKSTSEQNVHKEEKKRIRLERKLKKTKRKLARLQNRQNSGEGDVSTCAGGEGGDPHDAAPSQLSVITASTPNRKRTLSDGESIKSGHKKKKKKKKTESQRIPKINEKQSSIQASTPRLPPALFGDSGSPHQPSPNRLQGSILRSATTGWPSRLTNFSSSMVTSDNKLGRFDLPTTPTTTVASKNGPAKVDAIASPPKPVTNSAPADSMKTNSNQSEQQQEVVTSADDVSNTSTTEQAKQSPAPSTTTTTTTTTPVVADKQVSQVDSTADSSNVVVDNSDAVSSTTSPSPQGATEARAQAATAAASSPPKPDCAVSTVAESPHVAPKADVKAADVETVARGSVKNIADTTTVGGSSPLVKPETSSETVKSDNGDPAAHCDKTRSRNPKRWTVSEVCDYLLEREPSLEPVIHFFHKNEIDGVALLLITELNIATTSMKLGPALKICQIVAHLNGQLESRKRRLNGSRASQN